MEIWQAYFMKSSKWLTINLLYVSGSIYAARLKNPELWGYTLFGATLFPGFDDSDLVVYTRQELIDRFPQHTELIEELAAP